MLLKLISVTETDEINPASTAEVAQRQKLIKRADSSEDAVQAYDSQDIASNHDDDRRMNYKGAYVQTKEAKRKGALKQKEAVGMLA